MAVLSHESSFAVRRWCSPATGLPRQCVVPGYSMSHKGQNLMSTTLAHLLLACVAYYCYTVSVRGSSDLVTAPCLCIHALPCRLVNCREVKMMRAPKPTCFVFLFADPPPLHLHKFTCRFYTVVCHCKALRFPVPKLFLVSYMHLGTRPDF